jgi:hypothetical protein
MFIECSLVLSTLFLLTNLKTIITLWRLLGSYAVPVLQREDLGMRAVGCQCKNKNEIQPWKVQWVPISVLSILLPMSRSQRDITRYGVGKRSSLSAHEQASAHQRMLRNLSRLHSKWQSQDLYPTSGSWAHSLNHCATWPLLAREEANASGR